MRNLHPLDPYRAVAWELNVYDQPGNSLFGCFFVPSPIDKQALRVMATCGLDWDHVSVSRASRCPNWPEMDHVKRLFFHADEVVMQLHVAEDQHISHHPYTLHLWRPHIAKIPLPPSWLVAPMPEQEAAG